MSEYNLGTARGAIQIDGSAAEAGFAVAQTAAQGFFIAVESKIKQVQQLGRRLVAVGAAGVTGFGLAVKSASAFEFAIDAIAAVSGAAGDQVDKLRDKALKLGRDTVFSATEAAAAMEELVKAGVSVDDVLAGAADATVALAAAGAVDLPTAATIAANAMNQFGVEASKIPHVADLLAGAANASAADVEGLGASLSQVGAVANLAGLSLDDTVVALGELASKGIAGSDAGTSLKTMFLNLIPTTDRQIAKFKELGLMTFDTQKSMRALGAKGIKPLGPTLNDARRAVSKYLIETKGLKEGTKTLKDETDKFLVSAGAMNNEFFDSKGNVKDLRGLQEALANATEFLSDGTTKMTREEKLKNIEILFGTDAMRAAAIAALEGAEGYDEFAGKMKGITAADVAAKRLGNFKGAMEQVRGSVETLAIKVGTPLLGALTAAANAFAKIVNVIASLPDPIINVLSVLGAIVSVFFLVVGAGLALLPIIAGLVANWILMRVVRALVGPIYAFAKSLLFSRNIMTAATVAQARLNASWIAGTRAAKIVTFAIKAMAVAMRVLSFAFSGPGLLIIALVVGLVLLYKHSQKVRDIVQAVGNAIKGFLLGALEKAKVVAAQVAQFYQKLAAVFVRDVLPVIKKVGAELLGKLVKAGQKLWQQIQTQLVPAVQDLMAVFQGIGESSFGQKMKEWGAAAIRFGAMVIPLLAKLQMFFVSKILPILIKIVGFFAGVFIDTIASAISGVINIITGFVNIISGIVKILKGIFTGDFGLIWEGLKQVVVGAFQAILGAIKIYLAVGVLKLFKLGFTLIMGIVRVGWGLIRGLFSAGGRGLVALVKLPFVLIWNLIKLYISLWVVIIRTGFQIIRAVVGAALRFVVAVIRGNFAAARAVISAVIGAIRAIVSGGFNALRGIVAGAIGRLVGAIRGGISKARGAMVSIKNAVIDAISSLGGNLYNKGAEIVQKLIDGILSKIEAVGGALKKIGGAITSHLPGSPVKKGPLKVLNRGVAGGKITQMIADGILKQKSALETAMRRLTEIADAGTLDLAVQASGTFGAVQRSTGLPADAATPPGIVRPAAAVATEPTAAPAKRYVMVDGMMKTDKGFDVYVKGTAAEVDDSNAEFNSIVDRMNKPPKG